MAQAPNPLPAVSNAWISVPAGSPSYAFQTYFLTLDAAVRNLCNNLFGSPTQLVNAANDAAAAKAGVKVGQLYRNGSIVMVRVT